MLPYFNIITSNSPHKMTEIPQKPRRKKPDVLIHKPSKGDASYKNYGANFNSRKPKHKEDTQEEFEAQNNYVEIEQEKTKISRKILHKEIERLTNENEELLQTLHKNEENFHKKITKFQEKVDKLDGINKTLIQNNEILEAQNKELIANFEGLQRQLEEALNCGTCLELKRALEKNNVEYNVLKNTNVELTEDISMLKNVVYRLNVQMERYQDKLRNINLKSNQTLETTNFLTHLPPEGHEDHGHVPIAWGKVNRHTLGPLLDSYQDTLKEKDDIIKSYETELSNFTGKLKNILQENESLHKSLTEDNECSSKLLVEIESLKEDLRCTKEQNDLLIKKCSLKQDKLAEVLKCYEQKVDQMKRDYSVLHEQYYKSRTEIAALKERNKALIDSQDDFKNERQNYIPISVHTASVNECKKWYEELKIQYEAEKAKLREGLTDKTKTIEELNAKINLLQNEKDELETKIKNLEKHIKKHEGKYLDLQHTLNEVQLSRSACRKQLHKAMNFAKDLVTEQETLLKTLNQRQHENKVVTRIGSDIANRMDLLKNQLKSVQRDAWQELSSVEQRLQEQDSLITSLKQEHNEEVERLKRIIKEKEEGNILLQHDSSVPISPYLLFRDRHK